MLKTMLGLLLLALLAAAPDIRHLKLTRAERESEFPSLAWNRLANGRGLHRRP